MKTTVIYHRVDYDGIFSACIVKHYLELQGEEPVLLGWNYSDPIPKIETPKVIMVDIMLPPPNMIELRKTKELIVVDHHETSINSSYQNGYDDLPGLREFGKGACELSWKYFFNTPVPKLIRLLSAYDVWDHDRFDWKRKTVPLQLVLKAKYGIKLDLIYPEYLKMIEDGYDFSSLLEQGRLIQEYEEKQFIGACKSYVFPVVVAGKFRGAACLTHTFGSRLFESISKDYDVFITLNRKVDSNGNSIFTAGLYSDGGIGDFSLAKYVRETYGEDRGGGHPRACGCWFTPEEFMNIITLGRI